MDNSTKQKTPISNEVIPTPTTNSSPIPTPLPEREPAQKYKPKRGLIIFAILLVFLPILAFGGYKLLGSLRNKNNYDKNTSLIGNNQNNNPLLEKIQPLTLVSNGFEYQINTEIPVCTEVNSSNGKGAINLLNIAQNKIIWSLKTHGMANIEVVDGKYAVITGAFNSGENFALLDIQSGNTLWTKKIDTNSHDHVQSKLFGNTLVINSETTPNLLAVDSASGKDLWSYPKGTNESEVVLSNNSLYFLGKSDYLNVINFSDGKLLWEYKQPNHFQCKLMEVTDTLAYVECSSVLYAIDVNTHDLAFKLGEDSYSDSASKTSFIITQDSIYYGKSNQKQLFNSETEKYYYEYPDAILTRVDKNTGDEISQAVINNPFLSAQNYDSYILYRGSDQNYLFDITNSKNLWSKNYLNPITTKTVFENGQIYEKDDNKLAKINPIDGQEVWQTDLSSQQPLRGIQYQFNSPEYLIITSDNLILKLNATNGDVLSKFVLPDKFELKSVKSVDSDNLLFSIYNSCPIILR